MIKGKDSAPIPQDNFYEDLSSALTQLYNKYGKNQQLPGIPTIKSIIGMKFLDESLNILFLEQIDIYSKLLSYEVLKSFTTKDNAKIDSTKTDIKHDPTPVRNTLHKEPVIQPSNDIFDDSDDTVDLKFLPIPTIQNATDTGLICEIQNVRPYRGRKWVGGYICTARMNGLERIQVLLPPQLATWACRISKIFKPDEIFNTKFYLSSDGNYHAETNVN